MYAVRKCVSDTPVLYLHNKRQI